LTLLDILRAEGVASGARRLADRIEEGAWRRSIAGVSSGKPAVLNVIATAPARRLGGLQTQLLARLRVERELRPVALLHAASRGWQLAANGAAAVSNQRGGIAEAALAAAAAVGARAIHLEGAAGVPPVELRALARSSLPLVVSLHDFALWCARSDLLEAAPPRFCDFCRDLERCGRCLTAHGLGDDAAARRAIAAEVLVAAAAVVFPSEFLRDRHRTLFPDAPRGTETVIAPASGAVAPPRARTAAMPPRHVAFAGAPTDAKGAAVVADVIRSVRARHPAIRWTIFGGGPADAVARMRRIAGVRVYGYYRAGTLPALLAREAVDVLLVASIVPEAFSLVLSESWLAGVPVIATDLGAIADRIRTHGGGLLVPVENAAAGIASVLDRLVAGEMPMHALAIGTPPPSATHAAAAHSELYRALGFVADSVGAASALSGAAA
jgi:glycosyltransferase involved in cell wall biosynthesis